MSYKVQLLNMDGSTSCVTTDAMECCPVPITGTGTHVKTGTGTSRTGTGTGGQVWDGNYISTSCCPLARSLLHITYGGVFAPLGVVAVLYDPTQYQWVGHGGPVCNSPKSESHLFCVGQRWQLDTYLYDPTGSTLISVSSCQWVLPGQQTTIFDGLYTCSPDFVGTSLASGDVEDSGFGGSLTCLHQLYTASVGH